MPLFTQLYVLPLHKRKQIKQNKVKTNKQKLNKTNTKTKHTPKTKKNLTKANQPTKQHGVYSVLSSFSWEGTQPECLMYPVTHVKCSSSLSRVGGAFAHFSRSMLGLLPGLNLCRSYECIVCLSSYMQQLVLLGLEDTVPVELSISHGF